jgi:EspA/EspE family
MGVVDAFLSTWSDARSTFGAGVPQTGEQFDRSAQLRTLQSGLDGAAPGTRWTGTAATAYGAVNSEHQRVLGSLAQLDQRLGAHIGQSAEVVANGRRQLDALRRWVVDAAASTPPSTAGEKIRLAIVAQGLARLTEIVQRSNGELNTIGAKIVGLKPEYDALGEQKFGAAGGDGRDRNPDARDGRRIRSDEIFGRAEGGDRGGENLSTDWAGRAILERYLTGGDDWTITDDPAWSKYMMDNQLLRQQLLEPTQTAAQDALNGYLNDGRATGTFDQRLHGEIENGEGIVGYQYLHGTDSTVGDFGFKGDTTVRPLPDGTYEVTLDSGYTWNDKIDPNPIYQTDQTKSRVAEILTLGRADPYDMHINWHAQSTVVMDASGNVISVKGYPAP